MLGYKLNPDARGLDITIFVEEPFHELVRTTSRFWNASGIDLATGASGIDLHVASLQALLVGGIEFDTPLGLETARGCRRRDPLSAVTQTQRALAQAQFTEKIPFLVYFDGSVRGLNPGAPVEFRGINVGSVTSVQLQFDQTTSKIRIPVTIEIEPQRILPDGTAASS